MVSHNLSELKEFCDAGILLHQGQIFYFDDLEEAVAHHTALMA
jgi:capsular polysaccharide transport system ATP-binding protein